MILTGPLQRYNWILKILITVFVIASALATALIVSVKTELATLLFEVFILLIALLLSKANVANLVIAFIITDHFCQFLKRLIFVWGPQSHTLYYAVQLLPNCFILLAMLLVFRPLTRMRVTPSSKMLVAYAGVSLLASLINIRAVSLAGGSAGLQRVTMLICALFIGMMLPLTIFERLGRIFSALILISVPFGVYQFIVGPSAIDQAWAEAMHDYSSEAGKVWEAMTVNGAEFRAYAYYADPTTWGFFLSLAIIVIIISATLGMFRKKWLYIVIPTALIGLIVCETRSAWLALLGATIVYRLITTRLLRRPMLLIVGVLSSFAVVVTVGDYMTHNVNAGVFTSALANRYTTVGTMAARTSAWKLFARNLPAHWLLGTGFGYGTTDQNVSMGDEMYSHNMYVDALVTTGLPGLLLLLGFFYCWIKEAFWVVRMGTKNVSRAALWSISLAVGMLLTGSVQGTNFLTIYLCLILGFISGEWLRLKSVLAPIQIQVPARSREMVFAAPQVAFQK